MPCICNASIDSWTEAHQRKWHWRISIAQMSDFQWGRLRPLLQSHKGRRWCLRHCCVACKYYTDTLNIALKCNLYIPGLDWFGCNIITIWQRQAMAFVSPPLLCCIQIQYFHHTDIEMPGLIWFVWHQHLWGGIQYTQYFIDFECFMHVIEVNFEQHQMELFHPFDHSPLSIVKCWHRLFV